MANGTTLARPHVARVMSKTFLSWFGLLALVGLCGAAVAGLTLVKDRIRVVVQADNAADAAGQQTALLKDDLQQVQRDVRALADALGTGLRQLADEQIANADTRQSELTRTVAEATRAQREALAAINTEQQRVARAVSDLHATLEQTRERGAVAAASTPTQVTAKAPPPAAPAGGAPPSTTPVDPAPTPESTPPPRKRSAFAFRLPSQGFAFDLAQRFELLPSLSRVGFDVKSTLHDFTGVTSKLSGYLRLNLAAPGTDCNGEIRVDAASLDTGLLGRNDAMRDHLACPQHPEIVFTLTSMVASQVDRDKQAVTATVHGRMTIHGQTRDMAMPVQLSVDDSKRVHARGEVTLKLSDYGVPVPSQLGMIKMQDEVKVWVALQARALGVEKTR